jgi:hypothetical protein
VHRKSDSKSVLLAKNETGADTYDTMAKFAEGFADCLAGRKLKKWPGVFGRAYDRGAECAMRRQRPKSEEPAPIAADLKEQVKAG